MRALSGLGIGLSLVSGFLLLALVVEVCYLLWCKKRTTPNRAMVEAKANDNDKFLYLFCWKKPSSLTSSKALNPQEGVNISINDQSSTDGKDLFVPFGDDEEMEAELMRLHNLSGPPRFLFTIKEETNEELESFSDVITPPFSTPLASPAFFTPPSTPLDSHQSLLDQYVSGNGSNNGRALAVKASPPPKFKFLRDAEEKLYKKTLAEEAMRLHKISASPAKASEDEDGSYITIIIGKNRERGHPSSSQVNPLPTHGKLGSYLSSSQ